MNAESIQFKLEELIQELTLQLNAIPETHRQEALITFKSVDGAYIAGTDVVYTIKW